MMTELKSVLTLQEVAEYLRIHEMTAYRFCRLGKIPAFRVGGRWRCKLKDLEALMQNRTITNNSESQA